MQQTLHRLFRYKAWANDELLSALARLDAQSQVGQLAVKALSHSYVVDRIFAAHLRRQSHAYRTANPTDLPPLDRLSADIRESDREYLRYVPTLATADLAEPIDFAFTDGAPGRMSRAEMLMHVIIHGAGHRGQISALMLLNSIPPASDGFTTFVHRDEAAARRRVAA